MAKLSDLLSTREITANSDGLEKGKVWVITTTSMFACVRDDSRYCWRSPGCGTLTIEMWGAAGGGARMCCCGFGLPGNAPANTRKTIAVWPDTAICACPGMSCNAHSLCFEGCGVPSYLGWINGRDLCGYSSGCMCAQGGRGGTAFCSTGTSAYCCFAANGFCNTLLSGNCGIICNHCPGAWLACGYGGDINCCGCISCVAFKGSLPLCPCQQDTYIATAAMVYAENGAHIAYTHDADNEHSQWSGNGFHSQSYAINAASKSPAGGIPWTICYNGHQACGCYETLGCMPLMPYGVPGAGPFPCPDVRDHGKRGGHGAIRLTYKGSNVMEPNFGKLGGAY